MSRKGNCYDNACIESFHSVLKKELVYLEKFKTRKEAQSKIFEYIEFFYNRKRVHSAIGYLTPIQCEQMYDCVVIFSIPCVQSIDRGPYRFGVHERQMIQRG